MIFLLLDFVRHSVKTKLQFHSNKMSLDRNEISYRLEQILFTLVFIASKMKRNSVLGGGRSGMPHSKM